MLPLAGAPAGTVAFQRIDGLPEPQFRRLVQNLSDEAATRRIAVVSREGAAQYRVRGYAAAQIRGKHTVIAWVWDVYDASEQRVTRLGGEEEADNHQRGWGAADDQVLRRIAHEAWTSSPRSWSLRRIACPHRRHFPHRMPPRRPRARSWLQPRTRATRSRSPPHINNRLRRLKTFGTKEVRVLPGLPGACYHPRGCGIL